MESYREVLFEDAGGGLESQLHNGLISVGSCHVEHTENIVPPGPYVSSLTVYLHENDSMKEFYSTISDPH